MSVHSRIEMEFGNVVASHIALPEFGARAKA